MGVEENPRGLLMGPHHRQKSTLNSVFQKRMKKKKKIDLVPFGCHRQAPTPGPAVCIRFVRFHSELSTTDPFSGSKTLALLIFHLEHTVESVSFILLP